MSNVYLRFPVTGTAQATAALAALKAAGVWDGPNPFPLNMLGTQIPGAPNGIRGAQGVAAGSYTDAHGNTVNTPARGDPGYFYIGVRTDLPDTDFAAFPFASFGLEVVNPDVAATVLGTPL